MNSENADTSAKDTRVTITWSVDRMSLAIAFVDYIFSLTSQTRLGSQLLLTYKSLSPKSVSPQKTSFTRVPEEYLANIADF